MRESFVFYRSFASAIRKIRRPEERLALFDAIVDYALDGIEPGDDVPELIAVLMETIMPQIDANNARYENGKKGGRPKKETEKPVVFNSETSGFETENHRLLNSKPNVNVNVNVNDNVNADVNENGNGNGNVPGSQANTADAPSLSQKIISYLNEKTGSRYRPGAATAKIQGLLDQGYTEADMLTVIDRKCADWLYDDNMREHLRPSTLFRADKFEEYLNAPVSLKMEKEQKRADAESDLRRQLQEKRTALAVIREDIESMKDKDGRVRENLQEYRLLKEQAAILEDTIAQINRKISVK